MLLEGIQLVEPHGHPVERDRQIGDLVVATDGNGLGELAALDRPRRDPELSQGAGDSPACERGDGEGHREAGRDGEEGHQATLLVERFGQGSPPA